MVDDQHESAVALGPTNRDTIREWLMSVSGLAPVIGPVLPQLIGHVIPEQRLKRLEAFVVQLNNRLSQIEQKEIKERMLRPENIDLFERGAEQAARSISTERIGRIASVVATGISGAEKEEIESRRVLTILSEIDDVQLVMLASRLQKNWGEFRERHADTLYRPIVHFGSGDGDRDRAALYDSALNQLVRLGLVSPEFKRPRKGEMPDFDEKTGMMKSTSSRITPLGRIVLRYVGLADRRDH